MTTAESDAGMAFVAETRFQHERRRTIGVRLLPSTSGLWKHDIPERSARRPQPRLIPSYILALLERCSLPLGVPQRGRLEPGARPSRLRSGRLLSAPLWTGWETAALYATSPPAVPKIGREPGTAAAKSGSFLRARLGRHQSGEAIVNGQLAVVLS